MSAMAAAAASPDKKQKVNEWGHDAALLDRARGLHDKYVCMDGHNDLPWALHDAYAHKHSAVDLREPQQGTYIKTLRHGRLHTDIPRIKAGGLTAQLWSVYVPTTITGPEAVQKTLEQIDCVHELCARYPDTFEFAWTAADVRRIFKAGRFASMCGIEGGHQINCSMACLRMFHRLGVRYVAAPRRCYHCHCQRRCAVTILPQHDLTSAPPAAATPTRQLLTPSSPPQGT
jgi:hypothetical protein